jgi:hypothetical protein
MSNFVYILFKQDPSAAVLGGVMNVSKDYELLKDVSRQDGFSTDAFFDMLPDYGLQLRDFMNNGSDLVVVSERVKDFCAEQEDIQDVEFLPVAIVDYKGHSVETPYFIMHLLGFQEAIDEEQSEGDRWASDPESFSRVYELVLNESRIAEDKAIFRLQRYPYPVIVRRDLAERIEAAELTGISFKEIADFDPFAIL